MTELQEKHNYLYNSLDDSSNLAGFTADDLDVVDQIKAVANSAEVILIFAKNIENLSDFAYWRLLSYIWINGGYEVPYLFRKMFKMPIPNSNEVMLDEEYHFFKMLPKVITCYRVHHTNHEKDFLSYTLSPSKAVIMAEEFQRNNSFAGISEYKVNKSDVFAVFTRHWEDEILVLDRSKVRFERKVEVLSTMKPEKIDDKFVSYATGQLESAAPLSKWIIDACDKVKKYNAIPEEKRPNHSAVLKGTDNDDNYLLDCFADEYGNGDEVWIEIIPEDADDYKEMSYDDFDSNEKLKIIVAAYHHEEMEIVNIETYSLTDWLKSNNSKLLQALIKNKLIHEDTSKDHNCKPILSRDRNIYFCDECANQFELDAYNTNQDCCPICGASYDHLVLVGTRNGVRA